MGLFGVRFITGVRATIVVRAQHWSRCDFLGLFPSSIDVLAIGLSSARLVLGALLPLMVLGTTVPAAPIGKFGVWEIAATGTR